MAVTQVDILFYLVAYVIYMVISLILLLNLLIAMMSTTYATVPGLSGSEVPSSPDPPVPTPARFEPLQGPRSPRGT